MSQVQNVTGQLFNPSPLRSLAVSAELALSRQIYQAVRGNADSIITITPALAQRILDLLNFKRQRKLKPGNVMKYQRVILSGRWNPNHPIFFARLGELLVGTNLQHRMHAIVAADTAVRVRVIIAECSSAEAIAELYGEFDSKEGVRGDVDALVARDLAGDTGLSMTMVMHAMKALKVLMNDMTPLAGALTMEKVVIGMVETRIAEFPNWLDQVRQWDEIMRAAPTHVKKKLRNGSEMAVGLYTLKHQPESAFTFWMGLAENDKLSKSDPRARLLADFVARKGATPRELVQATANAWNAWYEKRQLALIRCDRDLPLTIAGTPLAAPKRKH